MPSFNSLSTTGALGVGAFVGGRRGWAKSQEDDTMDAGDRAGYTASHIVRGAAIGLGLKTIGVGGFTTAGKMLAGGMGLARKATKWNPLKPALMKIGGGKGFASITKEARMPLAGLALFALGGLALAYSSRPKNPTAAYANRDENEEVEYTEQPVRQRMGLLKATGDMVFGLNNSRHG